MLHATVQIIWRSEQDSNVRLWMPRRLPASPTRGTPLGAHRKLGASCATIYAVQNNRVVADAITDSYAQHTGKNRFAAATPRIDADPRALSNRQSSDPPLPSLAW